MAQANSKEQEPGTQQEEGKDKSIRTTRSTAISGACARERHGRGGIVEGGDARQKAHPPSERVKHNRQCEYVFSPTGADGINGGGVTVQGCAGEVRSGAGQTTEERKVNGVRDNGSRPRRAWGFASSESRGRRRTRMSFMRESGPHERPSPIRTDCIYKRVVVPQRGVTSSFKDCTVAHLKKGPQLRCDADVMAAARACHSSAPPTVRGGRWRGRPPKGRGTTGTFVLARAPPRTVPPSRLSRNGCRRGDRATRRGHRRSRRGRRQGRRRRGALATPPPHS